jgi:hypothetical protein
MFFEPQNKISKNAKCYSALFLTPFVKFNSLEDSYQEIFNVFSKLLIRKKTSKGAPRYPKYYT